MNDWFDFFYVWYISRVSVNEKAHRNLDNRPSDVCIDSLGQQQTFVIFLWAIIFMGVFVCPFAFISHSSVLPDISGISE